MCNHFSLLGLKSQEPFFLDQNVTEKTYSEEQVQDLTDRVFLLRDQLEAGKIFFAPHLIDDFRRSAAAIRLRPDGLVDPNTVDGSIRAATLMLKAFKYRDDTKKAIPLPKIQEAYFAFLFQQFGQLYDEFKKANVAPSVIAHSASRDPKFVANLMAGLPDIARALEQFWEGVVDAGEFHLQDSQQLKSTFSGDIFPAYSENVVSTAGLYIDTIVLPCPITRTVGLQNRFPDKEVARLVVKHVLTAMTYRDIAIADVNPPIVLILPNREDVAPSGMERLGDRIEPLAMKHAAHLFGRQFESMAHLHEFCSELRTVDKVVAELKSPDRLVFDTAWGAGAKPQLERAMHEGMPLPDGMDPDNAGDRVFSSCVSRMGQASGAQARAESYAGCPLIQAPTSWLYYTWLLEYEAIPSDVGGDQREALHIVHALTSQNEMNLEWLGNVPIDTVLEIRKQGLAEDVRAVLGQGVSDLLGTNPDNYFRTTDQVIANLDLAFAKHQQALQEAKTKKLKLYGIDVASCVVTGGIAVAAALTSNPALGAISGALGVAGLPNIKDIKSKYSQIAEDERRRKSSPTGLLFRHIK